MAYIKLTGNLEIIWEDNILKPKQSKPLYLLIYLAYFQDWIDRDKLAFLFWPDSPDTKSKQNLRRLIFRAKQFDFASDLEIDNQRLRWQVKSDIQIFKKAITNKNWQQALNAYRGEFLANIQASQPASFAAWLAQERSDLKRTWQHALNEAIKSSEQNNNYQLANKYLKQLYDSEILAEDVLQRYLHNCYLLNQKSEALEIYAKFKNLLNNELGLEPLVETTAIIEAIESSEKLEPLVSAKPLDQDLIPSSIFKPPKLIGRQDILEKIELAPNNIVLSGEAGIGKSRLIQEIAPKAITIKAQEGLTNIPFYPIISLIRELKHSGIKTPELGKYLDDLARLVPELSNSKAILINPELARARLFEALSLYFEQIIKGFNIKGFALAFDDLQWLDNSSLDFLIYLATQGKIKFIAAFRKFEKNQYLAQTISSLKASQSITVIGLEPLSTKDLEKLLASLMNANYGPPIFSKWLAKNTNGNPMFVLESLKNMFETGTLRAENKLWHTDIDEITKDYSEIEIPNIIEETILRRYSKLSTKTQRVLQITSAINQNFSPKQVSQILGLSEWAVIECFEEAQNSAIILEDRFQHDLLRQTIYKQISPLKAKLLHKKLAEQLAGNTNASIIAEHWYYADHAEKAAQIWLSTAIKLRNKGLVFEAISLIRNLSKYKQIPKDWRERLERILIACYLDLMEFDKLYELSQDLLKTSTNKLIIASAELFLSCYYRYAQSDLDKDLEHIQNANDLAEYVFRQIENDAELYEEFWYHLQVSWADYYLKKGDCEKALQYSLELVEKCGNCGILERAIDAYNMAGESYRQLADNKKALEYFNKAKELGKDMGQNALSPTINLLRISAELGQAEPYLSEAEELLKDYEFLGTDFANYIVGKVHFELNNNQKALFYLQKSIETNQGVHAPESYALLATIYKKQKQRAKSREFFKKAYQALERNKNQEISEATKQLIIENASKTMVQKIRQ